MPATLEAQPKIDIESDAVVPPPVVREDGRQIDSPLTMVRNLNELFDTDEEDEISFTRGMLRCLGHCALGTDLESLPVDQQIPPVNPWKLMGKVAKATVSKPERRAMMSRISEGMSIGDAMGLLGVLEIYGGWKRAGLAPKEAQKRAWGFYGKLGDSKPQTIRSNQ